MTKFEQEVINWIDITKTYSKTWFMDVIVLKELLGKMYGNKFLTEKYEEPIKKNIDNLSNYYKKAKDK